MKQKYLYFLKRLLYYFYGEKFFKRLNYDWKQYPSRIQIIQNIINKKDYKKYLEIGCDKDENFSRIKVENKNLDLISGSLLEVSVKFNLRNSLSVPDTSVMVEGDKSYVYKITDENVANKTEVITGLRSNKNIEILSGLDEGNIVVAEGLKKVRPRGKIKPISK